ncbi:MAG: hypothetical protein AAGA30_00400, partial [Planctomycetota bacterium]
KIPMVTGEISGEFNFVREFSSGHSKLFRLHKVNSIRPHRIHKFGRGRPTVATDTTRVFTAMLTLIPGILNSSVDFIRATSATWVFQPAILDFEEMEFTGPPGKHQHYSFEKSNGLKKLTDRHDRYF